MPKPSQSPPPSHSPRPQSQHDALAPLLFLILFVFFVYGSLIVALLGLSAWMIDTYQLSFFAQFDTMGTLALALCFLGIWLGTTFLIATIPYIILRSQGRVIAADKVRAILVIVLVHIFAVPFILWRVFRNNHPEFRHKYRQKLKRLAKSKKMQERLNERRRHKYH